MDPKSQPTPTSPSLPQWELRTGPSCLGMMVLVGCRGRGMYPVLLLGTCHSFNTPHHSFPSIKILPTRRDP